MRRLVPILVAAAVAGVLAAAMMGTGGGISMVFALPVALVALAWARHNARAGGVELRWASRTASVPVRVPPILGVAMPARAPIATHAPPVRRQVIGALARFESRQWVSSPWFAAGVGFCLLQAFLFGWVWADDYDGSWRAWFILMPIMAHPMVGLTVIGAHHAVTRGRRDKADELFATCPADESIRTLAQLAAAWVPAAVVVGFAVASSVVLAFRNSDIYGPIDGRALADVLAAIALAVGGSALGVAIARWAPWRLVPVVVVAACVPAIIELGTLGSPHWSNTRQLSTWPQYPDHDLLFTDPPVWWHLLWLAALGALMGWVAVVHVNRSRPMMLAGVLVGLVVAGAGIAETRGLSPSAAARLASMVAEPEQHQTCRSTPRVAVCVYAGYEGYLDRLLTNVAPVAAAVPGAPDQVTFRHGFDGEIETLGPEVAAALDGRPVPMNGFLPLSFVNRHEAMLVARLTTALEAVELPVRARSSGAPTLVAGEARGVVALWLAARGLEPDEAQRLASHHFDPHDSSQPTAFDLGMAWPDPCLGGVAPPVSWSAQDLTAARSLLELPEADVQALLAEHWAVFTDSATTTDDLLVAAGLPPVGPPDPVVATPVVCDW